MKAFFVFSGQGAQTVGMGMDLAAKYPEAKAVLDLADETLGYKLSDVIANGPMEKLTETNYCQVAIYTMSMACLAAFKARFGADRVVPVACAGLSLGEYGALAAAGSFSFVDGLNLLAKRAEFMDRACKSSDGTMASVLSPEKSVIKEVAGGCEIDIANYNSPAQTVISGTRIQVARAIELLKEKKITKIIPLTVAGAFHSRLMKSAAIALKPVLTQTTMVMPRVPVYHNFTGKTAATVEEIKTNLAAQVSGSVRWEECVRAIVAAGGDTMIEFGPGKVLTGLLRRTLPDVPGFNVNSVESLDAFAAQLEQQ